MPMRPHRVSLAPSTPTPSCPSHMRWSVALPITNATGAVGATPRRTAVTRARGRPRGRKVVGHAWCDRGPLREVGPARPWATHALRKPAAPVLCHWAAGGFGPLAFSSFSYFLNLIKSMQIQKFVQVWFELRKL
jgi:hypothetical protein